MNKGLQFFCLGLVLLLAGFLSWRAMHPVIAEDKVSIKNVPLSYYADVDVVKENLPEENIPVIIAQGAFADEENAVYTRRGMSPTVFAQRQISLALTFEAAPKNSAEILAQLDVLLMDWRKEGTYAHALVLNNADAIRDMGRYSQLILDIKKKYITRSYVIVSMLDMSWADKQYAESLKPVVAEVAYFMFKVPETGLSDEQKAALESFPYRFQLVWPKNMPAETVTEIMIPKNSNFLGSVFTIDPQKPVIKKSQSIGILPKFLRK